MLSYKGNFGQQLGRQERFNRPELKFPCSEITWKHYVSIKSHTQSAAILLLGKIPALPGKGPPCLPLHIGPGELASATLYALLSPTLR